MIYILDLLNTIGFNYNFKNELFPN